MPLLGRRAHEVAAVQVGASAVAEPPATREVFGAVGVALLVIVLVAGGEGQAGGVGGQGAL